MKANELKLRIKTATEGMIDTYFNESGIIESFVNSTLKLILDAKINELDELISLFEDKEGNVDAEKIIETYASKIGEQGFQFDIRRFVKNDFIRNVLPNKSLVIKSDDIRGIITKCNNPIL